MRVLALPFLLCAACSKDPPAMTPDDGPCAPIADEVAPRIAEARIELGDFGGIVFRAGAATCVRFEAADGFTDAVETAPMTPDLTFEIAGVTKTFIAAAVLLLAEEGKLELSDTLGETIPELLPANLHVIGGVDRAPEITVRQLLQHTSGLADHWSDPPFSVEGRNAFAEAFDADPDRLWDPREILAYVVDLTPIAAPGEMFHYSDTGYVLLGLLLEKLDGAALHEVLRRRIFDPLELQSTYLAYREPARASVAESHRFAGRNDLYGKRHRSAEQGLVSSTRDLERFMAALLRDETLFSDRSTADEMRAAIPLEDRGLSYGLGLYRIALEGDRGHLWGHDGLGSAFLYYWPEQRVIFTGTLNQTASDWYPLARAAVEAIDP